MTNPILSSRSNSDEKRGFDVAVASDGEEALAKVASFEPDLVCSTS
jgi:CheY-like chemotaxis protein